MLRVIPRATELVNEETGQDEDRFFLDIVEFDNQGLVLLRGCEEIDAQFYARLRRLDGYED